MAYIGIIIKETRRNKLYAMPILLAGMLGCATKNRKADEAKVAKETSVVQSSQAVPADSIEGSEETEDWSMIAAIPEDTNRNSASRKIFL